MASKGDIHLEEASGQEARPQLDAEVAASLLNAAKRVIAACDEVNAWMALGWPARTLVAEPDRNKGRAAFEALRAAVSRAEA